MPTYSDAFLTWPPIVNLWAVWQEREANRTQIQLLQKMLDSLEEDLAECEGPPPPPPPEPQDDRTQVLWATGLRQDLVESVIGPHDLKRIHAVVLTADSQHYIWGAPLIRRLKDNGVKVFAYCRAPVHCRIGAQKNWQVGIGAASPFEAQVYELVKRADAWVRDPAGNVMYHPGGYDAYITPWLVAEDHAKLVRKWVWEYGNYDGLLVDGLTTNQIYAGGGADFDRDGVADVVKQGWADVSTKQWLGLSAWRAQLSGVPIIGNGSWEPVIFNPLKSGDWWSYLHGAMDEDLTHPMYPDGDETKQVPPLSQRWEMHRQCAAEWCAAGKAYWLGSRARLHQLPREQELRYTLATALLVGAKWVSNERHEWLSKSLGKADGPAAPVLDGAYTGAWWRRFERGDVMVFPDTKDGRVTVR